MSDALEITFCVGELRERYMHGWGDKCADEKLVCCSWNLTLIYKNVPLTIVFYLVNGSSPLIIGMDVRQYSDTFNKKKPSTITIRRPTDTCTYKMNTYIDKYNSGNPRLRMEVVPHKNFTFTSLMEISHARQEVNLAKKVHRFGHATAEEMSEIIKGTGFDTERLNIACRKVYDSCGDLSSNWKVGQQEEGFYFTNKRSIQSRNPGRLYICKNIR